MHIVRSQRVAWLRKPSLNRTPLYKNCTAQFRGSEDEASHFHQETPDEFSQPDVSEPTLLTWIIDRGGTATAGRDPQSKNGKFTADPDNITRNACDEMLIKEPAPMLDKSHNFYATSPPRRKRVCAQQVERSYYLAFAEIGASGAVTNLVNACGTRNSGTPKPISSASSTRAASHASNAQDRGIRAITVRGWSADDTVQITGTFREGVDWSPLLAPALDFEAVTLGLHGDFTSGAIRTITETSRGRLSDLQNISPAHLIFG
ncbi:hypothetical protein DFH09DRAFT_1067874 [Mycena vulgaris]|nr:hypothetical protein DFH09DRAFT_1067874 [Mycena vulgaris]